MIHKEIQKITSQIDKDFDEVIEKMCSSGIHNENLKQTENQAQTAKENLIQAVITNIKLTFDTEKLKFKSLIDQISAENDFLRKENESLQQENNTLINTKNFEVNFLQNKIKKLSETSFSPNIYPSPQVEKINENLKRELDLVNKNWTTLNGQMQDILTENRTLREIAGVPADYGIDLNEIRMIEKQKIEDYADRVKILEKGIIDLENERISLKEEIKELCESHEKNWFGFNQLTTQQIKLVTDFAVNLSEGREVSVSLGLEPERVSEEVLILEARKTSLSVKNDNLEGVCKEKTEKNDEKNINRPLLSQADVTCKIKDSLKSLSENPVTTTLNTQNIKRIQLQLTDLLNELPRNSESKFLVPDFNSFLSKIKKFLLSQQDFFKECSLQLNKPQDPLIFTENPAKPSKIHQATSLYIKNLRPSVNESYLEGIFDEYGKVLSVKLKKDNREDKFAVLGCVVFEERSNAEKALKKTDGMRIDGRKVWVSMEKNREREEGFYRRDERRSIERNKRWKDHRKGEEIRRPRRRSRSRSDY